MRRSPSWERSSKSVRRAAFTVQLAHGSARHDTDNCGCVSRTDMRHTRTLADLLSHLRRPAFAPSRAPTIKLINYDWPSAQHWRSWALPRAVQHIYPCEELEKLPSCDAICRGSKRGVRVEEGWPSWDEVMGHGTE